MKLLPLHYLLTVCCLLTVVFAAYAQTGSITGKVIDAETNLDLPGANISIAGTPLGTVSDIDGNFSIINVPAGAHELVITYIGYENTTQTFDIDANATTQITVHLNPGVIMGDEVLILGDRLKGQAKALNKQKANTNDQKKCFCFAGL